MKTEQEFANFAKSNLTVLFAPLEEIRRKIVNMIFLIIAICLSLGGISLLLTIIFQNGLPLFILSAISLLLSVLIYCFYIEHNYTAYKADYKNKIISEIIKFVDPSLAYNPQSGIARSKYMMSGIFTRAPDRFHSEDHIYGVMGKTQIEFSELHSEYKTETTDKNGHKREQWHTIFKGIFIIADFNKEFKGRTVVLPDFAEKFLGFIGQKLQSWNFTRDQLIKLEDPEFEKLFVVYGIDQIESRYILTPSLMRRMIEFNTKAKKLCRGDLSFSFVGSKLFVAISCSKNLFEPTIFTTVNDMTTMTDYFSFINLSAGVIEALDLNTRIWTKT